MVVYQCTNNWYIAYYLIGKFLHCYIGTLVNYYIKIVIINNVYIIDYIRTPVSKLQGGLSEVRADDLAAIVIKEIVERNPEVPVDEIEDVIFGCANQAGEDNRNVARMALLLAGLP